jgi:hypothetical protein
LSLPEALAAKTALWATKELTAALGGDTNSAKLTQQGRSPGSINIKKGKGKPATLLHSQVQHLNEELFMRLTSKKNIVINEGGLEVKNKAVENAIKKKDLSSKDWAMCCAYFENHSDKTMAEALKELQGRFQAVRPTKTIIKL